jgi:hypothetical protein
MWFWLLTKTRLISERGETMDEIIAPPTKSILVITDLLDQAISDFAMARNTIKRGETAGADNIAQLLVSFVVRYVEGICLMANKDLAFFPDAMVLTRAAFEAAIRVLWLLNSEDRSERDARWLVYLKDDEKFLREASKEMLELGIITNGDKDAETMRKFISEREGQLSPHIRPYKNLPSFQKMMEELNLGPQYSIYRHLSQYLHGTNVAFGVYARRTVSGDEYGEFITSKHWFQPLRLCWFSLSAPGNRLIYMLGGNPALFPSLKLQNEIEKALEDLDISG